MNINRLLVKRLQISTVKSIEILNSMQVLIDDKIAVNKQPINKSNRVVYNDIVVQEVETLFYYAYHKPAGIESTQNKSIENNLADAVQLNVRFFPYGRLDKESEGLMILSNDGQVYKLVTSTKIEKEYIVKLNRDIDDESLSKLANGIEILGTTTLPCEVFRESSDTFKIILKQGLNRQIRRMCYKLGFNVLMLKRIRIGGVVLDGIGENKKKLISKDLILGLAE